MRPAGQRLICVIQRDRLVISIGIDTLAFCANNAPNTVRWNEHKQEYCPTFRVTESAVYAAAVRDALLHEDEIGNSLVTRLLDEAFQAAVDDGCEGVEYLGEGESK